MGYKTMLAELEARLHEGQVQFQTWGKEREKLLEAIGLIKELANQQPAHNLSRQAADQSQSEMLRPATFRGLGYR